MKTQSNIVYAKKMISGILVLVIVRLLKILKIRLDGIIGMPDTVSIVTANKTNEMDYYIFHTILLVSICFLILIIIAINCYYVKHQLKKRYITTTTTTTTTTATTTTHLISQNQHIWKKKWKNKHKYVIIMI